MHLHRREAQREGGWSFGVSLAFLYYPPWLAGAQGGMGACPAYGPRSAPHPLTLAVFRFTEALLLLGETVADTEASFNPPALPWLVPTNDVAAAW